MKESQNATVSDLKIRIEKQLESRGKIHPLFQQRLVMGGIELEPDSKLLRNISQIEDGIPIHVTPHQTNTYYNKNDRPNEFR